MAELMQADFAKVGVEVEIVSYEWGEYLSRSRPLDRDGAILLGWTGDNGDPDNFLAVASRLRWAVRTPTGRSGAINPSKT